MATCGTSNKHLRQLFNFDPTISSVVFVHFSHLKGYYIIEPSKLKSLEMLIYAPGLICEGNTGECARKRLSYTD